MALLPICTCAANDDEVGATLLRMHARTCARRFAYENQLAGSATPDPNRPPRVVCTKCPAVAKIHRFTRADHSITLWMECHGEHKWVELFGNELSQDDLLFHKMHGPSMKTIEAAYLKDAEQSERRALDMLGRDAFLIEAKHRISPDQLHELYELSERQMLLWQERVQTLKGRMK